MSFSVLPINLENDNRLLIEMMRRYLTPLSNERRYNWLYKENPDGPAKLWVLMHSDTNSIVGSAAVVPRRMYVGKQEMHCALLADLWTHPEYRTLGPALKLQRACLDEIRTAGYSLYYDFPQSGMLAVHKRLGIEASHQLVRLNKPLNVERKFGKVAQIPVLGRLLTGGTNRLLALGDELRSHRSGCVISEQKDTFGEDITAFTRQQSSSYGVCVARTATYLNWRFQSHFHNRFTILTAHQKNSLVGYIAFVNEGEAARIVDLFSIDDRGVKSDLVFSALELLRSRGALSVDVPCLSSHSQTSFLLGIGFFARETHPVIVSAPGGDFDFGTHELFLMDGDRES
jgi:GNAT superfamily N-acetyltransferase